MGKNSVKGDTSNRNSESPESSIENGSMHCEKMKDVETSEKRKKIWSSEALKEIMNPTCEELDYRREKSVGLNPMERYSKLFKCTKCQKNLKFSIQENKKAPVHTCLGVLMCEECRTYYEDGEFSVDSDGEDKYCRWCGEGGTIFTCSKCISGFCANCIKRHFSLKFFKNVQKDDNWLCFFCDPKPLWFQRYICSLAIQLSEEADTEQAQEQVQTSPTSSVNEQKQPQSSPTSSVNEQKQPQTSPTSSVNEQKQPQTSPTSSVNEQKQPQTSPTSSVNEQKQLQTSPASRVNEQENDISRGTSRTKRKRLYSSSSSDETDHEASKSPLKKYKPTSNPMKILSKDIENKSSKDVRTEVLFELQKLLKLSEYQMSFGATWCHDTSKKLSQSNCKLTEEGFLDECKKIKWFLSVLSTYLVQFSNSVDSIERNLGRDYGQKISDTAENHQSPYTTILQFLDFVSNQVKTFLQKGISFSDILEASVYDDGQVIGLKKNTSKNKKVDPVTTESDLTKEDNESIESKEENIEDDVTGGADNLEVESDHNNESTFLENGDNNIPPHKTLKDNNAEGSDSVQEIQKLLSILENA